MERKDRRKTSRVECENPICTQISIVKVNNKAVKSRKGNICVENISFGGLLFLSVLNMPAGYSMVIEFKFAVEEKLSTLYGYIVRKEAAKNHVFRYGVHFIEESEENKKSLIELRKIKTDVLKNSAYFCNGNVAGCLKNGNYRANRRKYKRYRYDNKFAARMNVIEINNESIQSRWEKIVVNDISKGGMQILSNLKLPIINKLILNFKILVSDKEICLKGIVVRQEKAHDNMYIYGINFEMSEEEMDALERYFNSEADFSNNRGTPIRKCYEVKFYRQCHIKNKRNEWLV